ncbi:MAG: GxxExxY protein [Prevotella sp.]|nr:GxxExxY protein [Prevotella sp.]
MEDINDLIRKIISCAYSVRNVLKPGYLESIYKSAMMIELKRQGLKAETEVPFRVNYRGHDIGEYRADLVVEGRVILELKAVENIVKAHEVQLINYLSITGIDDGLLINFGRLDNLDIKRKYRVYTPQHEID